MDGHVDWLSWTEPTKIEQRSPDDLYQMAKQKSKERLGTAHEILWDGQGIDTAVSRAPYRLSVARDDNGFQVYGASHTETILYELRGRGCEPLRHEEIEQPFVDCLRDRVSRFDYAVDIETETRPTDFANEREHSRFRSVGFIRSATGETVYVGSAKSDRFCRVYRYNPPHPRSHLLRVEFVFRRQLARAAARDFAQATTPEIFIAQLGNTYGFTHSDWRPSETTDERLRVPILERKDSDTVHWLYTQVAPALTRLLTETSFDLTEFLEFVYEGVPKQE